MALSFLVNVLLTFWVKKISKKDIFGQWVIDMFLSIALWMLTPLFLRGIDLTGFVDQDPPRVLAQKIDDLLPRFQKKMPEILNLLCKSGVRTRPQAIWSAFLFVDGKKRAFQLF